MKFSSACSTTIETFTAENKKKRKKYKRLNIRGGQLSDC
jgi:hypothetical protein